LQHLFVHLKQSGLTSCPEGTTLSLHSETKITEHDF